MRLLYLDFSSKTIVQLLHYSFNVAKMGLLERKWLRRETAKYLPEPGHHVGGDDGHDYSATAPRPQHPRT
jgi:hypothetical protein